MVGGYRYGSPTGFRGEAPVRARPRAQPRPLVLPHTPSSNDDKGLHPGLAGLDRYLLRAGASRIPDRVKDPMVVAAGDALRLGQPRSGTGAVPQG